MDHAPTALPAVPRPLITGARASPGERTRHTINAGLEAVKGKPPPLPIPLSSTPTGLSPTATLAIPAPSTAAAAG